MKSISHRGLTRTSESGQTEKEPVLAVTSAVFIAILALPIASLAFTHFGINPAAAGAAAIPALIVGAVAAAASFLPAMQRHSRNQNKKLWEFCEELSQSLTPEQCYRLGVPIREIATATYSGQLLEEEASFLRLLADKLIYGKSPAAHELYNLCQMIIDKSGTAGGKIMYKIEPLTEELHHSFKAAVQEIVVLINKPAVEPLSGKEYILPVTLTAAFTIAAGAVAYNRANNDLQSPPEPLHSETQTSAVSGTPSAKLENVNLAARLAAKQVAA